MDTEKQEQRKPRGNPGRPRGTTKSREGHRLRLGVRLSPEVHHMIQEGLKHLPPSSQKTAFVEQAIIHYYQMLTQSSTADQVRKALASENVVYQAEDENSMQQEVQRLPGVVAPATPSVNGQKDGFQQALAQTESSGELDIEQHDHIDEVLRAWEHTLPENSALAVIDIFGRLERVVKLLEADFGRLALRYSITASELFLLMALGRTAPSYSLAPRELVKALLVTPGAITKQVDRLTTLKIVERQLDTEDRRSILVTLTPYGHQLFHAIATSDSSYQSSFQAILKLSQQEQKELSRILRKLTLLSERTENSPLHSAISTTPIENH